MNDIPSAIQVRGSVFFKAPDTLWLFQKKTAHLLRLLQEINPVFTRLAILGKKELVPVESSLSDLAEKMLNAVADRDANDIIGNDLNTGIGPAALNRIGFSVKFVSLEKSEAAQDIPNGPRRWELIVQGNSAGAEPNGAVTLTLPQQCQVFSWEEFRRIVSAVASGWGLSVVGVRSTEFEAAIKQNGDIYAGQWMTYYRMPQLGDCLPSEVVWTRLAEGVVVESAAPYPSPDNPSDVAAGKRVREALDHLGLVWHSTYAIHGWPPDEEEWRYEEFISGAPRGRKYRLRCIDFDGYDAQRNVLLYAKLFRRLRQQRKEWGLRGWDGPVLNEARRQVRAANGTPIEWHVGLEEPAARVRTLLADYTDFKDEQLRVIYTPLSQAVSR